MRILMWFAIGFTAACAVTVYLFNEMSLLPVLIAAILAVVLFLLKWKPCKITAVIAVGCAIGFAWNWGYRALFLADPQELDGACLVATVTAGDYSYETDTGIAVDGTLSHKGKDYKIRIYLYDKAEIKPGDRITDEFTFRYTATGTPDTPTYHQGKGIWLIGFGTDAFTVTAGAENKLSYLPAQIRSVVGERIDALFPEKVAGFARALLLGDRSKVSYEMNTAFSVSGISHIIAVSGLHVSILCSVITWLCLKQRHLTALIGIPVLFVFAAVAGFTPSVIRACIMQMLLILSATCNAEYDPPTSLAASVLVILSINPLAITAVSFQLSVACMIGIYGFSGRIHKYLLKRKWAVAASGKHLGAKLLRMVIKSVSITFSVWIVTTPLCAIHFGMVSIVGILTNLLTVWVVTYIFCGVMLACLLSIIWLPLGIGTAWLVALPMYFVQAVAWLLSRIPYAAVYTRSVYICTWLALCYLLLAALVLLRFKRPGMLLGCMLAGLVIACGAEAVAERSAKIRASVLDVGYGQCVLLKYQDSYYLVDCGGSDAYEVADTASEYLLSKGIFRLDGVILTDYNAHRAGGIRQLLSRVRVDALYLPETEPEHATRLWLEASYSDRIHYVSDTVTLDSAAITMYSITRGKTREETDICVLFQPDNYDILILNDLSGADEQRLMQQTDLPELELLVVAGHGAEDATTYGLLLETRPKYAAISVGQTRFDRPGDEVLDRLRMIGAAVCRTDQDGTIEFRR